MNQQSSIRLRTGRTMPVIGFGTWQCTNNTAGTVAYAIKQGYRMIDTSGDYGTQPGVGEGLKKSGVSRESVYIVTKVEEDDKAYEATRKNLQELDTSYADLMLIHRPPQDSAGEELWEGLIRARKDGLAKDIGVSNYSVEQLQALNESSCEIPAVNQIEWSPFGYSEDMFEYCEDRNIIIQAYSPLTRGERLNDEKLVEIAARYDKTPAQILIRWNVQLGTVPLPKANSFRHLEENLDVFGFEIDDDDMGTLNSLNEQYSALGKKLQYVM